MVALSSGIFLAHLFVKEVLLGPLFTVRKVVGTDAEFDFSYLCGQNIFRLSFLEAAARIREDPRISRFTIRRLYPGALYVSVERRVPFAYISLEGREVLVVGKDGVVLPVPEGSASPVLEVRGVIPEELRKDIPIVANISDYTSSFAPLQRVCSAPAFFTLTLTSGETVLLPREELNNNLFLFYHILADLRRKGVRYKYLDLRFSNPVFLPA
ncbi:MAG: cell division protein FtsQ/DivIB [Candidatus Omnitrophota bacterium]